MNGLGELIGGPAWVKAVTVLAASAVLAACGGGTGDSPPDNPPPAVNQPPVANAGADQVALTGANVTLSGASSSDPDGSIASFAWTQTSGTPVTLTGASTATPAFIAPAASAALTFQLTVTDNLGASRTDTVDVIVNAPPIVNAGPDQTVLGGSIVNLSGQASSDANGTIASYAWTQTGGTPVTLTGANTSTPSFTAPLSVAGLVFQLTVTDDRGATASDTVIVNVNALQAPVIARPPTHVRTHENGSALFFVVAQGQALNYTWRSSAFGAVVKDGPEPFLLRRDAHDGDDADDEGSCFYVTVANAAGSWVSDSVCELVTQLTYDFNADGDAFEPDATVALAYGNSLLAFLSNLGGTLTGPVLPVPGFFRPQLGPRTACGYSGEFSGATLDGAAVTANTPWPLGQHTVSLTWEACRASTDEPIPLDGAVLIAYDFPTTFGVGTYTIHMSGFLPPVKPDGAAYRWNGVVTGAATRTDNGNGTLTDVVELRLGDDFTIGFGNELLFRQSAGPTERLTLERRLNATASSSTRAEINLGNMAFSMFDSEKLEGAVSDEGASTLTLFDDDTSSGDFDILFSTTINGQRVGSPMGSLQAVGADGNWVLDLTSAP